MPGRSILALLLLTAAPLAAQIPATTADGRAVMLYDNGTWKYAAVADSAPARRSVASTSKIDILQGKAALYYDPSKWVETASDEPGRTMLTHVNGDGMAMIVAERLSMPLQTLRKIALDNARKASPDVRVISERQLTVGGRAMLEMEFSGTMDGIPFTYLGRYYTGKAGSIQMLTFTGSNLFPEYEPDFREILSGFEVTD
ncbi:MAG TPA: hypothetical protein VFL88_06655 [Gemmatimonadales bacterium]|jgi:hypothetical protein|nr:hypothetical protein [Gemmatimonadales bacterium]